MKELLLVAFGGMLGSVTRYLSSEYFHASFPAIRFPLATFFVNIAGCLMIGIFYGLSQRYPQADSTLRLLCVTGFLGGFTTFSAFGMETLALLRDGDFYLAIIYAAGSLFLGVISAYLGLRIAS